ncbi:HNH endonuclease signature motif containing protein [Cumulibacter manganitolerans]|uniref:HNH endonuclease signature motif containing protein n=1 Tax=Cumulibacter manganitolerans TaxID=1884992 RepID=UPI001295A981|nr:HNH endonuclease signature motif containing protein [Cumulibacter manganitolerans]
MDELSGWADPVAYLTRTTSSNSEAPGASDSRSGAAGDSVGQSGRSAGAGDAGRTPVSSGDGGWAPAWGTDFESSPGAVELDAEIAELLGRLRSGLDGLLAIGDRGDLMALGPRRLIGVIQGFEAHRNALAAVDALLVEAAGEERLAAHLTAPTLPSALSRLVKISPAAAAARVRQAEQILPQHAYSAGTLECERPALRDAVRAGVLSCDQHAVISSALRKLATNPEVQAEQLEQAENTLVEFAASLTPDELKQAARVIDDCLLPDGTLPSEELTRARRGLHLGPARRDGTHHLTGSLTPELHAKLSAILSPLAAPKPSNEHGADRRSADQRQHDALEEIADRMLDSDALPRTGGAKTTIHVTISLEQLRRRLAEMRRRDAALGGYRGSADPAASGHRCGWLADTPTGAGLDGALSPNGARHDNAEPAGTEPNGSGRRGAGPDGAEPWTPGGWNGGRFNLSTFQERAAATTTFGTQLSASELLRLAEQAEIIPTFVNDAGGVLAYGRARRFASPSQVKALVGRDKGCSFPACTAPPEWCDSHHIIEWWRGGRTDIDNLTLLCGYHHREFLQRGWSVRMHDGIPLWIPPPWIDADRKPQVNTRIAGLQPHLDLSLFQLGEQPEPGRPTPDSGSPPGHLDLSRTDRIDDLDPLDDLIDLLEHHVTAEQRDAFHRDLADLLTHYGSQCPLEQAVDVGPRAMA